MALTDADPSQAPKQLAFTELVLAVIGGGAVMTNASVVSQPFASTSVTLQLPAQSPFAVVVPWPEGGAGDHETETFPVPPEGATVALPSHEPKQLVGLTERFGCTG